MEEIKISLSEVSLASQRITQLNQQMDEVLSQISSLMNESSQIWQSDGGDAIRSKYLYFASRFPEYKEIIASYARFLDYTVLSYDGLESTLTSNASSIHD
ncbi:MAG: pore-forming ESAT-6 family protein [Erysipelotrichaceae bacterium]